MLFDNKKLYKRLVPFTYEKIGRQVRRNKRIRHTCLETFMGVDQRTGEGSKPRIPRVVSKSDRDHGTATTDNRNLGLTPAVTISRSNLSLGLYPIHRHPWYS